MPRPATSVARGTASILPRCARFTQICSTLPALSSRTDARINELPLIDPQTAIRSSHVDRRTPGAERRGDSAARRQLTLNGHWKIRAETAILRLRGEIRIKALG